MEDMKKQGQEGTEKDDLLMSEADIIAGFLGAVEDKVKITRLIEIARQDPADKTKTKVYFRFEIAGLDEEDYNKARQQSTTYKKNRNLGGIKMPDETNTTDYRSRLIYEATVADAKIGNTKIWDHPQIKKALEGQHGLLAGHEVVEIALKAGEKDKIVEMIDELSGYDADIEDTAKK